MIVISLLTLVTFSLKPLLSDLEEQDISHDATDILHDQLHFDIDNPSIFFDAGDFGLQMLDLFFNGGFHSLDVFFDAGDVGSQKQDLFFDDGFDGGVIGSQKLDVGVNSSSVSIELFIHDSGEFFYHLREGSYSGLSTLH